MNRNHLHGSGSFALDSAVESRRGPDKTRNEDTAMHDPTRGLFAVADGVSSCLEPDQASRMAIHVLQSQLRELPLTCGECLGTELLRAAVDACNQALFCERDDSTPRWLTTLMVASVGRSRLSLAHGGDSRAYLWQQGALTLLTRDHTVVADLVHAGMLRDDEAGNHPRRNVLSSCLGLRRRTRVDQRSLDLHSPWVLMLCSDGISNMLSNRDIQTSLSGNLPARDTALALLDTATKKGTDDDATVIIVRPQSEPKKKRGGSPFLRKDRQAG